MAINLHSPNIMVERLSVLFRQKRDQIPKKLIKLNFVEKPH